MPLEDLHIIDPLEIPNERCPVFVQCSDMRSFFGFGIRKRTSSNWNHSSVLIKKGILANQSWTFKKVDIKAYMTKGQIMKFWICFDLTEEERNSILMRAAFELSRPWHKRM